MNNDLARKSLYGLSLEELRSWLCEGGFPAYAAGQIFHWVYKKRRLDMSGWSNVGKALKRRLQESLCLELPRIIWHRRSNDGTRKFLIAFADGQSAECVLIPMARGRWTLCLSSQVGCAIGCTFCHTGTMGFSRHLRAEEIVGQYLALVRWPIQEEGESLNISNLVYMGQGEPLHNFENVRRATLIFMEDLGLGFGQRRITLSTSGLVPQIEKLWSFPPVNIAISLHAAHDKVRSELMPINKVYDLKRLFAAIGSIPLKARRRITYEYLLIDNVNDREEDLDGLRSLISLKDSMINLIPYNEHPGSDFKRPTREKISWFQKRLLDAGYVCTVRATKGDDILAACGQLKSAV